MIRPTKEERTAFNVDYADNTDFSAYARLLQSKWRECKQYPYAKYGNFLETKFAMDTKANFLTENIKNLVTTAIANSDKEGAMIRQPRIWDNLLSSQPLCFNLFGELHFDLELATAYFKELFPNRIDTVTAVKFEYSAGRGNKNYTGDHSAFDVFVEYKKDNSKGFIGIEVKYAESLQEEKELDALATFNRHQSTYTSLTQGDIFKPTAIEFVSKVPLSQIWRDHLLSIAHKKDYDEGFFVFLFPKGNTNCQKGVDAYISNLISADEEIMGFYPRYLDDFIRTLRKIKNVAWTKELEHRYLGKPMMNTEYFKLANQLNEEFKPMLLENELHFRGSLGSMSLISLSPNTPELGIKCNAENYNTGNNIEKIILEDLGKIKIKSSPKRPTPEKHLQAWIIKNAFNSQGKLPFGDNIQFITSELALESNSGTKVVADILGYSTTTKQLCIIELKSSRLMKELINQVNIFEEIIFENFEFFTTLLFIKLNIDSSTVSKKVRKIIIWPHEHTSPLVKLKEAGIEEITYHNVYTFNSF
ncbi:PGN_0703 family putative restriction endonuclease [Parasediminibacterium sp. JCM 36343]|uniref:PGN_0703 family putative restriction endonuclease n=1 Tax=Parasediminibacterium sp. JCM 36343 TaxID=3374279 RepID=UPI003977E7FE